MKHIVIFALNIMKALQQSGGGGGGSSGGGGGSSGGSSGYRNWGSGEGGDCSEDCWIPILVVFSMIILGFIIGYFYKNGYLRCDCYKIRNKKQRLLQNFLKQENNSNRDELLYGLEILGSSNWNMSYFQMVQKNIKIIDKKFEINYNQEFNKYHIDIHLRAQDSFGDSTYIGHIKQMNSQWKIFMIETYQDRIRSKQFGEYAILVYEGFTNSITEGFTGKWYFHDAQQSYGEWRWLPTENIKM
ncbi:unnamed protein product [Paramecium sonneborni]|uniref:Uncharacterized protein n=1 Tax=Paramecium sonneborni TaxID=65129 RepID=A0A8S1K3W8_9CILI|nr:unnamed protein product [Paramecium sonneborni]